VTDWQFPGEGMQEFYCKQTLDIINYIYILIQKKLHYLNSVSKILLWNMNKCHVEIKVCAPDIQ